MKKVITIIFTIILCIAFVAAASAQGDMSANGEDAAEESELKTYIEEKIVPVLIGVVTSIIALLGSMKGILKVLKELKGAKSDFFKIATQNKEDYRNESATINNAYNAIKESVKDVPVLLDEIKNQKGKIERLEQVMVVSTEILSLAYSASSELIRTGKAKEMNRLLNKLEGVLITTEQGNGEE